MKKLTRLTVLALVAVMLLASVVACGGKKEAITPEAFKTAAEAAGMTVEDASDVYTDSIFTGALLATHPDGWKVVYLAIDTAENAHKYFDTMKTFVEGKKTGAGSSQTTVRDTWASYSQTNGGEFAYVGQIGASMIYVEPVYADSYKEAIQAFIKTIGY